MGMGSRSQKVFDEWEIILNTSSSDTEQNELLGAKWGDESAEEDFQSYTNSLQYFWKNWGDGNRSPGGEPSSSNYDTVLWSFSDQWLLAVKL